MSEWQPIGTAPKDPSTSIELGLWNNYERRWAWLSHGAWNGKDFNFWDDERCYPTHWRPIGKPAADESAGG